jgi:hypothetical protein
MSGGWLVIEDAGIDAREVARRVEDRMSRREREAAAAGQADPASVARALWQERFGEPVSAGGVSGGLSTEWIATWLRDCEIVPRGYAIDWRLPVLGPIHALIRRIINAEVRRYLLAVLEKQSLLNRKVLETLEALAREQKTLARENASLRREVERLRGEMDRDRGAG